MEQEDLERDLIDVETPSQPLAGDPLDDLPEVRKSLPPHCRAVLRPTWFTGRCSWSDSE